MAEAAELGLRAAGAPPFLGEVPHELYQQATEASEDEARRLPWRVLFIKGKSGSGKSTLLKSVLSKFGLVGEKTNLYPDAFWSPGVPIIEHFRDFEEAQYWFCTVGLSAVPTWCKPFKALSTGEQYRANVARAFADAFPPTSTSPDAVPAAMGASVTTAAEEPVVNNAVAKMLVFDEWTAELDRGVARSLCVSLRKRFPAIRARAPSYADTLIIFASCHYDVEDFLHPDAVVHCEAGVAPHFQLKVGPGLPEAKTALTALVSGVMHPAPLLGGLQGRWVVPFTEGAPQILIIKTIQYKINVSFFTGKEAVISEIPYKDLVEVFDGESLAEAVAGRWSKPIRFKKVSPPLEIRVQVQSEQEILCQIRTSSAELAERREELQERIDRFREVKRYLEPLLTEQSSESTVLYRRYSTGRLDKVSALPVQFSAKECTSLGTHPASRTPRQAKMVTDFQAKVEQSMQDVCHAMQEIDLTISNAPWSPSVTARRMPSFNCGAEWLQPDSTCKSTATDILQSAYEAPSSIRLLTSAGWYVPPESRCEDLYPGMKVQKVTRCVPPCRASQPQKEAWKQRLVHLATYVGEADGSLSSCLESAARYFDHGFSGLCIHRIPALGAHARKKFYLGVILGTSGSGKTTLAQEHFGDALKVAWQDAPLMAHFRSLAEARPALEAAGLALDVALRPVGTLSGGERERASLAYGLAEWAAGRLPNLVFDEFTSLLDRRTAATVAAGVTAFCRKNPDRGHIVLMSCHEDIVGKDLLEPDWVFDAQYSHYLTLSASSDVDEKVAQHTQVRHQRWKRLDTPRLLHIRRALPQEWRRFREHHYKDHSLSMSACCFVGELEGRAIVFSAMICTGFTPAFMIGRSTADSCAFQEEAKKIGFPREWGNRMMFREHRTVVLPDAQGLGLGPLISDALGQLCEEMGFVFMSTTAHATYGGYRNRSPFWAELSTSQRVRPGFACPTFSHLWRGARGDPEAVEILKRRVVINPGAFPPLNADGKMALMA